MQPQDTAISRSPQLTCEVCGKVFHRPLHRLAKSGHLYCSKSCSTKARHAANPVRIHYNCAICGKPCTMTPHYFNKQPVHYCGHSCANKARTIPAEQRFWSQANRQGPDDCWLWTGATFDDKYGAFTLYHGETVRAHRYSWELANGPMPRELLACHTCDVTLCVNPRHVFAGTTLDNSRDMMNKGRGPVGERGGNAKLTDHDVLTIRNRAAQGEDPKTIAPDFSVGPWTIRSIVERRSWKHLP